MRNSVIVLTVFLPAALCVCTQFPAIKSLRLKDVEGMWYGQYTLKRAIADDPKCQRSYFYVKNDGKTLDLTESTLPKTERTSKGDSFYATGKQISTDGKLTMSGKLNGSTIQFQYWILATDFKNYMVASMCIQGMESAWIMTRKPESIDSETMKLIVEALKTTNLNLTKFNHTPQERCT